MVLVTNNCQMVTNHGGINLRYSHFTGVYRSRPHNGVGGGGCVKVHQDVHILLTLVCSVYKFRLFE